MKNFVKPSCEVVHFRDIIAASNSCGCWDGAIDWGYGSGANCTGDVGYCACQVNHYTEKDNCTPCATWEGN